VKFILRHDAEGIFLLSPQQGETARQMIPEEARARRGDSVIVRLAEGGGWLEKSAAAIYVGKRLDYRASAAFVQALPRWLADFGYNVIAKTRYAIFGRKQELCPLIPLQFRERFLP
jgi:predicted DCC family thiol-disulfide oxidoreductase YuxK